MNTATYVAIKLKLEKDKMEIEQEISVLQTKKTFFLNQKRKEEEKLSYSTKILKEQKTVRGAMLRQSYNLDIVKKSEREIAIVDGFIMQQNMELEKVKEQEKYLENLFQQELKEKEKKERKKEEEVLLEYKQWSDFDKLGGRS